MDNLTTIITTAITTLLGGGGTIATIIQVRKSRAEKISGNELEANKLVEAQEETNWQRQEQLMKSLDTKVKALDERITALGTENSELRITIKSRDTSLAVVEMWAARLVFNVHQANQGILVPLPMPSGVAAYFPAPAQVAQQPPSGS